MARQHKAKDKPNFTSHKTATSGGRLVKGKGGKKHSTGSQKPRGKASVAMHPEGNYGPCPSGCGHCVSCLIYKGDRANSERISRATGW